MHTIIRDFRWCNIDSSQANAANVGLGFIMTLGMDQAVRLYDISGTRALNIMTLMHDHLVGSLALSPDNSMLAVGGQGSEISVWSLRD